MIKKMILPLLAFLMVACSSQAPLAPSWKDSLGSSNVEPINKNLIDLQKEFDNKNVF